MIRAQRPRGSKAITADRAARFRAFAGGVNWSDTRPARVVSFRKPGDGAEQGFEMTHNDLILEAVNYRRNAGADLASIRSYLQFRDQEEHTSREDQAALHRLEQAGRVVRVGKQWFLSPSAYRQLTWAVPRPKGKSFCERSPA